MYDTRKSIAIRNVAGDDGYLLLIKALLTLKAKCCFSNYGLASLDFFCPSILWQQHNLLGLNITKKDYLFLRKCVSAIQTPFNTNKNCYEKETFV